MKKIIKLLCILQIVIWSNQAFSHGDHHHAEPTIRIKDKENAIKKYPSAIKFLVSKKAMDSKWKDKKHQAIEEKSPSGPWKIIFSEKTDKMYLFMDKFGKLDTNKSGQWPDWEDKH